MALSLQNGCKKYAKETDQSFAHDSILQIFNQDLPIFFKPLHWPFSRNLPEAMILRMHRKSLIGAKYIDSFDFTELGNNLHMYSFDLLLT